MVNIIVLKRKYIAHPSLKLSLLCWEKNEFLFLDLAKASVGFTEEKKPPPFLYVQNKKEVNTCWNKSCNF